MYSHTQEHKYTHSFVCKSRWATIFGASGRTRERERERHDVFLQFWKLKSSFLQTFFVLFSSASLLNFSNCVWEDFRFRIVFILLDSLCFKIQTDSVCNNISLKITLFSRKFFCWNPTSSINHFLPSHQFFSCFFYSFSPSHSLPLILKL